jgi:anti-anti-sigma factor
MSVTVKKHGPIAVVAPSGELWGGEETAELSRAVERLTDEGNTKLILDLSKVGHVNRTGLGTLIQVRANYINRNGRAVLCGIGKSLTNILVVTKLSAAFEVFDTEAEAIASLQSLV